MGLGVSPGLRVGVGGAVGAGGAVGVAVGVAVGIAVGAGGCVGVAVGVGAGVGVGVAVGPQATARRSTRTMAKSETPAREPDSRFIGASSQNRFVLWQAPQYVTNEAGHGRVYDTLVSWSVNSSDASPQRRFAIQCPCEGHSGSGSKWCE